MTMAVNMAYMNFKIFKRGKHEVELEKNYTEMVIDLRIIKSEIPVITIELYPWASIVSRFYQRFAPIHINTQVDLFADNTTLLAATDYNDINELNEKLSLEVSNVENWAITNKLPL
jgi:hypothetical protein